MDGGEESEDGREESVDIVGVQLKVEEESVDN